MLSTFSILNTPSREPVHIVGKSEKKQRLQKVPNFFCFMGRTPFFCTHRFQRKKQLNLYWAIYTHYIPKQTHICIYRYIHCICKWYTYSTYKQTCHFFQQDKHTHPSMNVGKFAPWRVLSRIPIPWPAQPTNVDPTTSSFTRSSWDNMNNLCQWYPTKIPLV